MLNKPKLHYVHCTSSLIMVALLKDLKAEVIFLPRSAKTIFAVKQPTCNRLK